MDIRDEVAAWRQEARQTIPVLRRAAEVLHATRHSGVAAALDEAGDRLRDLCDMANIEPEPSAPTNAKGFSSSYTQAESRWTTPRVLRNG